MPAEGEMTERLIQIKNLLLTQKKVYVGDLSEKFSVSKVTIRHDLTMLEQEKFARRIHGGAILLQSAQSAGPSHERHDPVLDRIAARACEFINNDDILFLGPGKTCCVLARALSSFSGLCVFTNNLSAADILLKNKIRVYLMGGEVHAGEGELLQTGPSDLNENTGSMYVIKAFYSVSGIDLHAGLTVPYFHTSAVLSQMQDCAKNCYLMADHTKFDQISVYPAGSAAHIEHLITDSIPPKYMNYFQRTGTQIHIA